MSDVLSRLQQALSGRYTVERELGRGGMAAVFLARDLRHDRHVAIKVLHPEVASSVGTDRFEREIRFAARLQHPHILPVHDSGDVPGGAGQPPLLWFSMPFVDGESLRERIGRERQLPVGEAVRIAREVADALEHAHRQGLIHRDIKPENILISGGHALVADFGVARALTTGTGEHAALTGTGLAIGTPAYMSPEQASGEQGVDQRSDIYALGCVLYEMLAGEPPFSGPTAQAIITRLLTEQPRVLSATRPGISPSIERVVATAIARAPADRFATAAEFSAALETAATTASQPIAVPPSARRTRSPLAATLAIGFLLGLGVLFAWTRVQRDTVPDGPVLLAVLPFENLGDSGDAYFADGITDEVRSKLAGLPDFQVIARASSNQYRATTKQLPEVARELNVRYLLTGTVRLIKADGQSRLQVRPELVEVEDNGAPVRRWAQPYDAAAGDVFQVQTEVASRVAGSLRGELAPQTAQAMSERPTGNMDAYDAYLRGEQLYYGSSGAGVLNEAMRHYETAVTLDSTFARSWARLAMARASLYVNSDASRDIAEAAMAAAARALVLAPNLPEAYLAQGNVFNLVRADFASAIEAYRKGLAIAPSHPELLGAIGLAEQGMGNVDAALDYMQRGLKLDPRSLLYTRRTARLLNYMRRYDEAGELIAHARALAPTDAAAMMYDAWLRLGRGDLTGAKSVARSIPKDRHEANVLSFFAYDWTTASLLDEGQYQVVLRSPPAHFGGNRGTWGIALAGAALVRGDTVRARAYADSALPTLERNVRENPNEPVSFSGLGVALALLGRKAEAIRMGEQAVALRITDGFQGPGFRHNLVRIFQLTGEPARAIAHLDTLTRMPYYISPGWLRVDPTLESLRSHPSYQALLSRVARE